MDSTYLKLAHQAGLTEEENTAVVAKSIQEAIDYKFKLIMIRPEMVSMARRMIDAASSSVLIGTVIDFPQGTSSKEVKCKEALAACANGADELDYVVNYVAFKKGEIETVKNEVRVCTILGTDNKKAVKWIIETAALTDDEITAITSIIRDVVTAHLPEELYSSVFIKSSTGE